MFFKQESRFMLDRQNVKLSQASRGFLVASAVILFSLNTALAQMAQKNTAATTVPSAPAQPASAIPAGVSTGVAAPVAQPGNISGTIMSSGGGVVSDATVSLLTSNGATLVKTMSNEYGGFAFNQVPAGGTYTIRIEAPSCIPWNSQPITIAPGQFMTLQNISVRLYGGATTVVVRPQLTQVEIATQQVQQEVKQRVLGFIPNFYVTYAQHPAPLTTKLKFKLAVRASFDPVTIAASVVGAGIEQAADYPNYQQGFAGYMQRFGANYGNNTIDIMLGGAIFPSLLHQDPRYFYQGTGTTHSRLMHAISAPFICYGDNGKREINYSSMGGDIVTGAISNLYYPASNRGPGLVFSTALITTGGRILNALAQEFILRKFTSHSSGTTN